MKLFLDCEFTSFQGDLISMALIDENDTYFYEVIEFDESKCHPWVTQNVLPILLKEPITKEQFEHRLYNYLKKYNSIEVIADWPDDIKYFCEQVITAPGEMMELGNNITMQIQRRMGVESSLPHNALEDAIGIKEAWYKLQGKAI